ncbi:MAG: protein kinase [Brasilonema octagenarum HA4186-MV1]|jgi:serine/threonine protein kinase|uniref:Serine/threonine protein kinase n=1 Tax=Brasilonema octagenarum UFV-OR1 TaxID=417115 RepID=A0ABX1ME74_9CYAN|nr:serine/threonine-protein kinase [Brasilonema octagenarum]MBW4624034.1 protein kinase [Brasilonema octagenarum HA4186-MV1]NMF66953.1 serine/threonine protein kinase [Brasilonema octagenarum UFV-OR1]
MLQTQQVIHNRYQLKEKLGEGAGRQTWLALDLSTQDDIVVKLLTFSDQMQWESLKLFEREAQVLKQLNHPRIPDYRNYFCIDDQLLYFGLVQEYIPGTSLKQLLTKGQVFAEPEVRKIAAQILKILIYLHGLSPPVLHRDVKPSNVLVGKDSGIYLVDFGAVQDRAAREGATFTVVGTYGYAPLEQFGGRATPASDLYALGATLIHLLTGISPADLPQKDSRLQFAHLVRLNPGFVRWLEQLTEPNLERRFSSAQQALDALRANQNAIKIASPRLPESCIWVDKSPRRLQIQLHVPWYKVISTPRNWLVLTGLGLWLFWLSMLISGWVYLFWLAGSLVLGAWFLLPVFAQTNINFDHQQFEIEVKLLGFCIKRQRGNVLEIDNVFKSDSGGYGNKKIPEVTLAVGVEEYSFGRLKPPLSHQVCRWLVDEIKHWLGL